jgi:excisionase family DNA binding protein
MFVTTKKAAEVLGLHPNTLRRYADNGRIEAIRTEGGQRRYNVASYVRGKSNASIICYCRVSSSKQKDDLARQVVYMRKSYPDAEIIRDIGSGLNFKRKGLRAILERLLLGDKLTIIVAHRDRLCRFGFELFEHMVKSNGGELLVLDDTSYSPEEELTKDLLSILHVFSCRMHGLRRYHRAIKEDPDLSNGSTEAALQQVV